MRELEDLIEKRIQFLEESFQSEEDENNKDKEELEALNKKIDELKIKKNKLSLTLTECKNKLDILEKFYYSVDKLGEIEEKPEAITKDDLQNIDKIDSLLDEVRDKWIVDVQLARYYLMHKESIKAEGLEEAIEKVHKIFLEIKRREEKLHEDIEKYEEGIKTANKTIREYQKKVRELEKVFLEREKEKERLNVAIELLKSISTDGILTLEPKFMDILKTAFGSDKEYLELLKEIVKHNSTLLKTNPKLEKLLLSVKEKLDNATTLDEKEQLTELYLLLIYSKSGRDKDGIIQAYLESTDYNITDIKAFLKLVDIDMEENLKLNREKMAKKMTPGKTKALDAEALKKYNVLKTALAKIEKGSIETRIAKYLVVESEESIDALYNYIVLYNVSRQLKTTVLTELSEKLSESDDKYLKVLSKIIVEIVRNKYNGNRNENDINDYQMLEERLLSIVSTDREKMIEAFQNRSLKDQIVINRLYDDKGNIDISKVKEILLLYKRKELAVLRAKADNLSPLKRVIDQIDEIVCDERVSNEFIDDLIIADIKDERQGRELLNTHISLLFESRKRLVESITGCTEEEALDFYYEALLTTNSRYIDIFDKMRSDIYNVQDANFNAFKPFLSKVMIKLVEEDLKNNTDSSDLLRNITLYFKKITEAGHDDYSVYDYLHEYASRLNEIELDEINNKNELVLLIKDTIPNELKGFIEETEEEDKEIKNGTLVLFRTEDESDLFHQDVNHNETGRLIETGLRHLRGMTYDALTKHQGSVDKIKNSEGINGLFRYRSGNIRICYKVIEPEIIETLNKNNEFEYQAGIVIIYIVKKQGDSSIYNDEVVPRAVEFIENRQRDLLEELTIGSPEAIENTIRSHERIYKKYTRQGESGIGARSYE